MDLWREDALLERALELAGEDYAGAYRFLLEAYRAAPEDCGAQTLYFLACLAGGCGRAGEALAWLEESIGRRGWWYRPEVLEDGDLAALAGDAAFLRLLALSRARYAAAAARAAGVCSWRGREGDRLLLAVHGNTQNAGMARAGEAGYARAAWAGFSAGCDALLRTLLRTPLRCDVLLLQSPWLPVLAEGAPARLTVQEGLRHGFPPAPGEAYFAALR